jgi:tRNA pseudouridine38-40 synthase
VKRYRLGISYDGTEFHGWGVQPDQRSVQGALGEAVEQVFGDFGELTAAGRTDAGVHASGQTAHLDLKPEVKVSEIAKRLNAVLPDDLVITGAKAVPDDFHARYHCLAKQYVYRLQNTKTPPLFDRKYVSWERRPLELQPLRQACKLFEGEQDFKAFMNVGREMDSTVRNIIRCGVKRRQGQLIFSILGTGFLYNQIRIMLGTLIQVGLGKRPPECIKEILESKDRQNAGNTAEPRGLDLRKTIYTGDSAEKMLL